MNIVIVGQGAMGLLWYHYLSQLKQESQPLNVSLLASNQKKEISTNYTFTSCQHNNALQNPLFQGKVDYTQKHTLQRADIIIFCLKSYQVAKAIVQLSDDFNNHVTLILAHNGMGTLTELPNVIRAKHKIMTLLTTHGCLRTAPLTITHTGLGKTDLGFLSEETFPEKTNQPVNALKNVGLSITTLLNLALPTVEFHSNIEKKQWLKLAINCVINPVTAINNIDNGLINQANFDATINEILTEIVLLAKAEQVSLTFDLLKENVKQVADATASNRSSMRCDILAHQKTEIDYINGYIHHLGLKHNIATPTNTLLWQQVNAMEKNFLL
ncbi:MAG: 2-dehydropantoate 2-reductase [Colwellia sp.]